MNKIKIITLAVIIALIVGAYIMLKPYPGLTKKQKDAIRPSSRPVVVILIDSLMDKPLQKAIKENRAPALSFLKKNGHYFPRMVSAYPTMSVTIDSTLLTGSYSNLHHLPGLVWYNEDENRLVNYGSDKKELMALGLKQSLKDGMYNLNNKHLNQSAETIHEALDKQGKQSASINGLIYRGNTKHELNAPRLLDMFELLPEKLKTKGPFLLSFGRFTQLNPHNRSNHLWQGYGLNDTFTAQEMNYLIKQKKLPSLTLAYMPDLDHSIHKNGPMDIKAVEKVDKQIQDMLNTYGSWDEALKNIIWIVMGDSGQAAIGNDKHKALIRLKTLLKEYRIPKLSKTPSKNDQLVLGVNERMAFVYLLDQKIAFSDIASKLNKDPRMNFTTWKENHWIYVTSGESNKSLRFQPNGSYKDKYNQTWNVEGDLSVLDLSAANKVIRYGDYPDALARLYGALHSHKGRYLIADAKPGFEFVGEKSPAHLGGAGHGSLHKTDTYSPMIIVGSDKTPKHLRHTDLKDFFIELTKE
ncbi:alkaline phosphatase family protein [Bacillus atrophaeus]|uniref:alkaline phosphatase family protein n=1 Tax=Bacillus atrophaeus TaxID=1452 RepID=UPI00228099EF|nr:alkaline phosphatase family protein [Bacillus atrophaeus]MCY9198578.1 alkaline phosphatase family protein [Bacillus atrophaeus]